MGDKKIFGYWLQVFLAATEEEQLRIVEEIKKLDYPSHVGGVEAPCNYNSVSIDDIMALDGDSVDNLLLNPCRVVLGLSDEAILKSFTMDVLKMASMNIRELEKVSKAFKSLEREPTPQEKRAGISKLKSDIFSLKDYYARRMGITDHNEAGATPWIIIWRCSKDDKEKGEFEQRLQKVYNDEARSKTNSKR